MATVGEPAVGGSCGVLLPGPWNRAALTTGLLGLLPLAYLARGGRVLDFHVLAAIPFLCVHIAIAPRP